MDKTPTFKRFYEASHKMPAALDDLLFFIQKNHFKDVEFEPAYILKKDSWKIYTKGMDQLLFTYDPKEKVVDIMLPKGGSRDFPLVRLDQAAKEIAKVWKNHLN